LFWAHFRRFFQSTGNRAIRSNLFALQWGKKYFRFYPLRGQNPASCRILTLEFCEAKLLLSAAGGEP
jgi:hypothetical protein